VWIHTTEEQAISTMLYDRATTIVSVETGGLRDSAQAVRSIALFGKNSALWAAAACLAACVATTILIAATPLAADWNYDWWLGALATLCLFAGLSIAGLLLVDCSVNDDQHMQFIGVGLIAIVFSSVVVAGLAAHLSSSEQLAEQLMFGRAGPMIIGLIAIIVATASATARLPSTAVVVLTITGLSIALGAVFAIWQPPTAALGFGLAGLLLVTMAVEIARDRHDLQTKHGWIAVGIASLAAVEALVAMGGDEVVYLAGATVVTAIGFISARWAIRAQLLARLRSDLSAIDALHDAQRQLQAQRRSQEHTLAQLAHDNRSTALALESAAELIHNSPHAPPELLALSNALGDEVGRMRRTVADLTASDLAAETHLVWDAIESVVRCRSTQVNDLRVDVNFGVRAYADPDTLAAVVDSLMANAVEHGGGGLVSVSVVSSDNSAVIAVEDDGPGVPEACREVIWEQGVTSKRGDHQGLGLYGAAQRASTVDASIRVTSSEYGGARFEVHVPMTPARSRVPMAHARSGR
jgi:signal transduction histidine kinase